MCGKTSASAETFKCIEPNCPNICHSSCLNGSENFNCSVVSGLRSLLSIPDDVIYIDSITEGAGDGHMEEADNGLLQLENRELVAIIRKLQTYITQNNSILNFITPLSFDIASKRDAVVSILEFIDNITATKSSLEELEVKSTACSACPDKIDADWSVVIAADQQLNAWWTSGKPRKLRKVCHLEEKVDNASTDVERHPNDINHLAGHQNNQSNITNPNLQQHNIGNQRRPSIGRNTSFQQPPPARPYAQSNKKQQWPLPGNRAGSLNNRRNLNNRGTPPSPATFWNKNSTQTRRSCNICGKSGHTETSCFKRQKCDHCQRFGHIVSDCRTRLSEERQERFFRNLVAEQTQQNTLLLQSFQRNLPFHQVNHTPTLPGAVPWASHPNIQSAQTSQTQHHYPFTNR